VLRAPPAGGGGGAAAPCPPPRPAPPPARRGSAPPPPSPDPATLRRKMTEGSRWVLARAEEAGGTGAARAVRLLVELPEGPGATAGGLARALAEQHGVPVEHQAVLDRRGCQVGQAGLRLAEDLGFVLVQRRQGGGAGSTSCSAGELFTSAAPGGPRERQVASRQLGFTCALDEVRVATLLDPGAYLGGELGGWQRAQRRRRLRWAVVAAVWALLAILTGLAVWHVAVYPLPRPQVGGGSIESSVGSDTASSGGEARAKNEEAREPASPELFEDFELLRDSLNATGEPPPPEDSGTPQGNATAGRTPAREREL